MAPPQLQSKFASTYDKLLQTPATIPPTDERFWDDIFCLNPDVAWLRDKIAGLGRAGILGTHQHVITSIFAAAKSEFSQNFESVATPVDEPSLETKKPTESSIHSDGKESSTGIDATTTLRRVNAARTLQGVTQAVLSVPAITGWEIMDVLAGGVGVSDAVFTELVGALVNTMGDENESAEMRHSALQLTLALVCGLGQLSPGAYFLAQDMFSGIVSIIRSPATTRYSFEAFLLLAVLANYHRVDAASLNPYLRHIQETHDEMLMQGLLWVTRFACARSVKAYRDIYDDTPPSFTSTMSSIFSALRPAAAPPPMKELFGGQPIEASVILFPLLEFLSQNYTFRATLAGTIHPDPIESQSSRPSSPRLSSSPKLQATRPPLGSPRNTGTPLGSPRVRPGSLIMATRSVSMASVVQRTQAHAQLHQNVRCMPELLSLASYVLAHAGTTAAGEGTSAPGRAEAYAGLVLDVLEQCVADEGIVRAMCSPPVKDDVPVWLCRQRVPLLPLRTAAAPLICSVIDVCVLYLRHNLSKKLDCRAYLTCLTIIHRAVYFLQIERVRIEYHWNELWRAIIAALVFVLAKQDTIQQNNTSIDTVIAEAVLILDLAIACADGFLPTPEAVHQLVYEAVRSSSTLRELSKRPQQQKARYNQGLQDLLMTIEFYEGQLDGTRTADDVMRVLAREIERDGVHGVSAREREEPGTVKDTGDPAFIRWACADGLALVS